MVGRAGRAGIDDFGESYLIVQPKDQTKITELIFGSYDACHSSLAAVMQQDSSSSYRKNNNNNNNNNKLMKQLILSIVGLEIARSLRTWLPSSLKHCFMCRGTNSPPTSFASRITPCRN